MAVEARDGAILGNAGVTSETGSSRSLDMDEMEEDTVPASEAAVWSDAELLPGLKMRKVES